MVVNRIYGTHKNLNIPYFEQQYWVLFNMVPRNNIVVVIINYAWVSFFVSEVFFFRESYE